MVVMVAPSASEIWTWQERTASPFDMHGAGAAFGDAAAVFRAGQPQLVAQDPEQRRLRLDIELVPLPVDGDGDHAALPPEAMVLREIWGEPRRSSYALLARIILACGKRPRHFGAKLYWSRISSLKNSPLESAFRKAS